MNIVKKLEDLPRQINVVMTNLLTYLIAAQTLITVLVAQGELIDLPEAVRYGGPALTSIAAAITFIRRVTPVVESERGILPREDV